MVVNGGSGIRTKLFPFGYCIREIEGIPREISDTGVLQMPTTITTFSLPSNATDVDRGALQYAFNGCTSLTSVDLSNLISISGDGALISSFSGCTSLTSVNLSNLISISGSDALSYSFRDCISLTTVDFSSLSSINNTGVLSYAFEDCTSLSSISFPALNSNSFGSNTDQFSGMLLEVSDCTVHFPSNLQSVIGSWYDVTAGFDGDNTTVLFDLPATT